jgi:hypothetical protein
MLAPWCPKVKGKPYWTTDGQGGDMSTRAGFKGHCAGHQGREPRFGSEPPTFSRDLCDLDTDAKGPDMLSAASPGAGVHVVPSPQTHRRHTSAQRAYVRRCGETER